MSRIHTYRAIELGIFDAYQEDENDQSAAASGDEEGSEIADDGTLVDTNVPSESLLPSIDLSDDEDAAGYFSGGVPEHRIYTLSEVLRSGIELESHKHNDRYKSSARKPEQRRIPRAVEVSEEVVESKSSALGRSRNRPIIVRALHVEADHLIAVAVEALRNDPELVRGLLSGRDCQQLQVTLISDDKDFMELLDAPPIHPTSGGSDVSVACSGTSAGVPDSLEADKSLPHDIATAGTLPCITLDLETNDGRSRSLSDCDCCDADAFLRRQVLMGKHESDILSVLDGANEEFQQLVLTEQLWNDESLLLKGLHGNGLLQKFLGNLSMTSARQRPLAGLGRLPPELLFDVQTAVEDAFASLVKDRKHHVAGACDSLAVHLGLNGIRVTPQRRTKKSSSSGGASITPSSSCAATPPHGEFRCSPGPASLPRASHSSSAPMSPLMSQSPAPPLSTISAVPPIWPARAETPKCQSIDPSLHAGAVSWPTTTKWPVLSTPMAAPSQKSEAVHGRQPTSPAWGAGMSKPASPPAVPRTSANTADNLKGMLTSCGFIVKTGKKKGK